MCLKSLLEFWKCRKMKKAPVVGGNSGLGLSIAINLLKKCDYLYIVGNDEPDIKDVPSQFLDDF